MRNLLFLFAGVLLVLGIFFARDRLKRAFQLGAVLYAIVLIFRFLVFGIGDPDSFLDVLTLGAVFFLIWVVAWLGTQAILSYRQASRAPPDTD